MCSLPSRFVILASLALAVVLGAASFVGFDLLAMDGRDLRRETQGDRRAALERLLGRVTPPIHLTPVTRDRNTAAEWLQQFEGGGTGRDEMRAHGLARHVLARDHVQAERVAVERERAGEIGNRDADVIEVRLHIVVGVPVTRRTMAAAAA